MNKLTISILSLVVIGLVLVGAFSLSSSSLTIGARQLQSTITNTSSSVGMTDTLVNTPANYQYFSAKNIGDGRIGCAFTTTSTLTGAVLTNGLRFESSSTNYAYYEITDPSLLSKYIHCIADTTSTLSILKY